MRIYLAAILAVAAGYCEVCFAEVDALTPQSIDASGLESIDASGLTSIDASGLESIDASGLTSIDASGLESIDASGLTSIDASGLESIDASGLTSIDASGLESIDASGLTSIDASGLESIDASGLTSIDASGLDSIDASGLRLATGGVRMAGARPIATPTSPAGALRLTGGSITKRTRGDAPSLVKRNPLITRSQSSAAGTIADVPEVAPARPVQIIDVATTAAIPELQNRNVVTRPDVLPTHSVP